MAMNLFKKIGDLIDGTLGNQGQEGVIESEKPIDEQPQESSGDSKAEEKTSSQPQTSNKDRKSTRLNSSH